jgi:hypothetical protein
MNNTQREKKMKNKATASFIATLVMLLSVAFSAWAQVPPPPANQKLFIPDTSIAGLTEAGCRNCHNNPLIVPAPGNVDRHHLLVGQTPAVPSVRPFPARDDNGTYACFSCHNATVNPTTGEITLEQNFRNCINCHNSASPHHSGFTVQDTPTSTQANCQRCHGSVIENPPINRDIVPAWIPTYAPSLVTPWTSGKDVANNTTGVVGGDGLADPDTRGNCTYCHAAGSVTDPAFLGPFGPVPNVLSNQGTHHSTGFGVQADKCFWCHGLPPVSGAQKIRKCENCHSIATLHNIQADSPAAANLGSIVPGAENLGWGHVGSNWDCNGCHGFTATAASTQQVSGSILPSLSGLSKSSVTKGVATAITVSGQSFLNTMVSPFGNFDFTGQIQVTDAQGVAQTLVPTAVTASSIDFVMPADLAAGSYSVQILKATKLSNALTINVVPETRIISATCENGTLTVVGTGFGTTPPAVVELGAFMNGVQAKVATWADDRVVATGTCGTNVALKSAFGTVTGTATVTAPPVAMPAITKLSTTSARVGSTVTIYGTNLGAAKGTVKVGTTSAYVSNWRSSSITFKVPKVTRGTHQVTVSNASGSLSLQVR